MRSVCIGALAALVVIAGVAQAQGREGGARRISPEMLKKYDKNGDGKLDRAEIRQMLADRRGGEGEGRGRRGRGGEGERGEGRGRRGRGGEGERGEGRGRRGRGGDG